MSMFKLFGLLGILIEIAGAAYMVYASFATRRTLRGINPTTFGGVGEMAAKTHDILSGQIRDEIVGFSLLSIGLAMQFISGLA